MQTILILLPLKEQKQGKMNNIVIIIKKSDYGVLQVTHLYSRYQARVDAFQQLPGVENVATTDTVILMTDKNAPTTELRL
ncbi:hypothetical protein ACE6H2_022805 [Prunus campanulata]